MLSESGIYYRSVLSNSMRREVLWNVVEPSDPYDIRKSTIARLPGDKKIPMGNHMELVCLLQAAEIERLSEFLEDYKLKLREVDRTALDRHSYEVQIKELTLEILSYEGLKAEGDKMRGFIRKQSAEIQNLQRNYREVRQYEGNFKATPDANAERISQLLNQCQRLANQNQGLAQTNDEYRKQIQTFNARMEAFEQAKRKQIDELRATSAQYSKETLESTLHVHKFQFQGETRRLQFELKRVKIGYDQATNQITFLKKANQNCVKQLSIAKGMGDSVVVMERNNAQLERRLAYATNELERLSIALQSTNRKYEECDFQRKDAERRASAFELQLKSQQEKVKSSRQQITRINEMMLRLEGDARKAVDSQTYILHSQAKIKELLKDKQQLSSRLAHQVSICQRIRGELERSINQSSKSKQLERQNAQLKQRIGQLQRSFNSIRAQNNQLITNIQEITSATNAKINESTLEINKLNSILRGLDEQKNSLQNYIKQHTQNNEKQRMDAQRYVQQLRVQLMQAEVKYTNQLNQAAYAAQRLTSDNQSLKKQLNDYQVSISAYQAQANKRFAAYQQTLYVLGKDNQDLKRKVRELDGSCFNLKQELDVAGRTIRAKQQDITLLQGKVQNLISDLANARKSRGQQESSIKYEIDNRYASYESTIQSLRLQQTNMQRTIAEQQNRHAQLAQEHEKNLQALQNLAQDAQRMKNELITRGSQAKRLESQGKTREANVQNLVRVNEQLQEALNRNIVILDKKDQEIRLLNQKCWSSEVSNGKVQGDSNKIGLLEKESSEIRRQLNIVSRQTEQKIAQISQLLAENGDLRRKIANLQQAIAVDQVQANQRIADYEQNIKRILKEKQQLDIRPVEGEMALKLREAQAKLQSVSQELENSTSHFREITYNISIELHKKDEEIAKLQEIQAQTRKQVEILRQQISIFHHEIENLDAKLSQKSQEAEAFQRQCRDLSASLSQSYEVEANQKNTYEQVINQLKDRAYEYEANMAALARENERLTAIIHSKGQQSLSFSLSSEQQELKKRSIEIQNAYKEIIEAANRENQQLRKRLTVSQGQAKQEIRKRSQGEVRASMLQSEIDRLNQVLSGKTSEIDILRRNIDEYRVLSSQKFVLSPQKSRIQSQKLVLSPIKEKQDSNLVNENEELRGRIFDLSEANRRLGQNQSRLLTTLKENQQAIVQMRMKIDELLRVQEDNRRLLEQLQQTEAKLQNTTNHDNMIEQYERRIAFDTQQINHLQYLLKENGGNFDSLERKLREALSENDILRRQIDLQKQKKGLSESFISKTVESRGVDRQQLGRRQKEWAQKNALLRGEAEVARQQFRKKSQQCQRAYSQIALLKQFAQKKNQQAEDYLASRQHTFVSPQDYENAKRHLQQYQLNLSRVHAQFSRLQDIISDLKREREAIIQKNHNLSEEITRIQRQKEGLQGEVKEIRLRLCDQMALEKRLQQQLGLLVVLFAQIQSLRRRLKYKEQEVQTERRRSLSPNIL